jgi:hypothetical protein
MFSQRLEQERSAREFESMDLRSQLRVYGRSPSPFAQIDTHAYSTPA